MIITDELRKWAEDNTLQDMELTTYPPQHAVHGVLETLLRIADRIDAEHERVLRETGEEIVAENAKLRELVDDLYFDLLGEMPESMLEDRRLQMRELGIEVDG